VLLRAEMPKLLGGDVAGFVGVHLHPEDRMGEVSIIAVHPEQQRHGIGRALMEFSENEIRAAGMKR
jgi:N-acetylglutamate synthase-like GNAT family acetyltransferase